MSKNIQHLTEKMLPFWRKFKYQSILMVKPIGIKRNIKTMSQKLYQPQFPNAFPFIQYKNQYAQLQIYNGQHQQCLCEWATIDDKEIGGLSTGQISYHQNALTINAKINSQNSTKMITFPFWGITPRYPFNYRIGAFQILQLYCQTDGQPLHVDIQIQSVSQGDFIGSGVILSRSKQWNYYEIPIINMRIQQNNVPDEQRSMRKIINELQHPSVLKVKNISLKVMGTTTKDRYFHLKSIKLLRRIGHDQFINQYRNHYFFITNNSPSLDLSSTPVIDTGDRKWIRKK